MAIKLDTKTNVDPASATWPFGDVRDKTISIPGTKWNKQQMSDMIQFFEKLMDAAGVAHNGQFDNDVNGFQLFEAFSTFALTKQKIIPSGDWDMQTDVQIAVPHGLPDVQKIRQISFILRDDTGTLVFDLGQSTEGAIGFIDATNVLINRINGGFFDSANFNDTGFDRGHLLIHYVD